MKHTIKTIMFILKLRAYRAIAQLLFTMLNKIQVRVDKMVYDHMYKIKKNK